MMAIMKCINIISRCATLYRSEQLHAENLTGCQHTYILTICRNPGISQEQLSKLIYIHKSNVARQLPLLEQTGFIERKCSEEDKRILLVYPTQKAWDVYPKVVNVVTGWNRFLTEDFSEEEKGILQTMLDKIMQKSITGIDEHMVRGKAEK